MYRNLITFGLLSSKLQLSLTIRGKIFLGTFASFEVLITKRFESFYEIIDLFVIVENLSH